jgi:hypothetical protein
MAGRDRPTMPRRLLAGGLAGGGEGMVQTRVTLRPGMPCRKMLPVIGLLPKFAEPSVTLLPSELTLAVAKPSFSSASLFS